MKDKLMRYVRCEDQSLQLHILEYGTWKHYKRVLYLQQDSETSTPGFRTAQYYMQRGWEMLPTISIEAFNGLIKLAASMK